MTWDADSRSFQYPSGECGSLAGASFDTAEKHQGNASMRITITDNQQHRGCRESVANLNYGHTLTDGSWIYFRWWMKIDANFRWGSAQRKMKTIRIKQSGDIPPAYLTSYLNGGGVRPVGECVGCTPSSMFPGDEGPVLALDLDPVGGCNVGGGAQCTDWNEYIVGYKWQTGSNENAEAHVWVNGISKGSMTGYRIHSGSGKSNAIQTWGRNWMIEPYVQICPNGSSCGAGGTIWVDDFSTDDTWNSNAGGTPPATRPAPPEFLSVN